MGLQLVERGLDLPALGVTGGKRRCRRFGRVEDRSKEPILLLVVTSVVEGVVDDAQSHRRRVPPLVAARRDLGEPAPVGERLSMAGLEVRLRPPAQVGAGASSFGPQLETVETSIGEEQHSRLQPADEIPGELDLRRRVGADHRVEDRVRPTLCERDDPGIRVRGLFTFVHPRTAEVRGVLVGVSDVEAGPVDRHKTPPGEKGAGCALRGEGTRDPGEQRGEWLGSKT